PGQCNMFNNFSYRPFSISGGPNTFTFTPQGNTVRMQPAIQALTTAGATIKHNEPDPGNDGMFFVGYNVTHPSASVWHYEYAVFNMNLDRAIQSFSVPLGPGVNISNVDFHAPPQHPGWAHDGTQGDAGFSSTPWDVDTSDPTVITWSTETFAQNQNANAIRWGTLYNFRFDADQGPNLTNSTVGFFKNGSPVGVVVDAPGGVPSPTPSPTPTATPPVTPTPTPVTPTPTPTPLTPTPTPTITPPPSPTATMTPPPSPTPSATATATVTPPPSPTPTPTATATSPPRSTRTPTPIPPRTARPTPHPKP